MSATKDALDVELEEVIHRLILSRRRYALLLAIRQAFSQLAQAVPEDQTRRPFADHPGWELFRDTFAMLVIDLWSLRERIVRDGVLELLRPNRHRLRSYAADDYPSEPRRHVVWGVDDPEERTRAAHDSDLFLRTRLAEHRNAALQSLFPSAFPIQRNTLSTRCACELTDRDIDQLVKRVIRQTKPLDEDRNRVRAHRHESAFDIRKAFRDLADVKGQLQVLDDLAKHLALVLTDGSWSLDLDYTPSAETFASDLADLLVHGTINSATLQYGLAVPPTPENRGHLLYWAARERFIDRGLTVAVPKNVLPEMLEETKKPPVDE